MSAEGDRSKLVEIIGNAAPELAVEMVYRLADAIIDAGYRRQV